MIEDTDQVIQHAETQEKMAYRAKKQAYHDLQERIHRRYGEDILDHYKVRKYALQVRPSYESSNIDLYLHILPTPKYEETIKEIKESDIEQDYRVAWHYKASIEDEIREMLVDDWNLKTNIHIKVKTQEQFKRLKK